MIPRNTTVKLPKTKDKESILYPANIAFKNKSEGLPWWRSGWESACQCRGHGFEPWSGRIPHAAEQLSLCNLGPMLCNGRGHHSEKPVRCSEEWPPLAATGEGPRAAARTQRSQK